MANYGTNVGSADKILSGACRIFVKKAGGTTVELGFVTEEGAKLDYTNSPTMVSTSDRSSPVKALDNTEEAKLTFALMESDVASLAAILGATKDVSGKLTGGSQANVEAEVWLEGMGYSGSATPTICRMGLYRAIQMGTSEFGTFKRGDFRRINVELTGMADTTKDPDTEGDLWYYEENVTPTP